MLSSWMIVAVVYGGLGVVVVLIGLITMLGSSRRRELINPWVFLRTTGLGILVFLFWPGMVLLGIGWQFPAGRAWMIGFFGGARNAGDGGTTDRGRSRSSRSKGAPGAAAMSTAHSTRSGDEESEQDQILVTGQGRAGPRHRPRPDVKP